MEQSYEWSQTSTEVTFKLPVDASLGKDKLRVKIESGRLSVTIAGAVAFANELSAKVVEDDSYWQLEGSGENRSLVVILCKKKATPWRSFTKGDEEALPQQNVMDENFDVLNLEHDDDDPERVEEQEENERKLEARYKMLKEEKGLEDETTLQTFFALFDNCIQLYRLNKLADYLMEIVPVCRKRNDKYKLKAIQALAFVRWKQSKFREALPLFHEMEDILGKGAALCENIAHTYNSLGDYDKAEEYFRQALRFIEQEHGANQGNRGGVLLGLGLVRDRLGKHREALPVCKKAYEFYKERAHGAPASLQAKAGISLAKLHAKLGDLTQAEFYIREAVQMYEVTCGETSPLTASAYHELGKCLWKQRKREDAQKALKRGYEIESMKDAWDLVTLLEIHNLLMDTHLKETDQIERSKFQDYFKIVEYVTGRVRRELPQDGNAAVYYKAAAEMKSWGGCYAEAQELFLEAVPLFEKEKATDCSGLIQSCQEMLAFCERNLQGMQNSPMNFEVPSKAQENTADLEEGPIVEEVVEPVTDEAARAAWSGAVAKAEPVAPLAGALEWEYRPLIPSDWTTVLRLCVASGTELLLADSEALTSHVTGPGLGLCWGAERAGELEGLLLAGSDGVYGHVLQLMAGPNADVPVRTSLLERCGGACRARGLRGLRASLPMVPSDRSAKELGTLLNDLGWQIAQQVYEAPSGEWATAPRAAWTAPAAAAEPEPVPAPASSSSAAAASSTAPAVARPAKPREAEAWNSMNVEKVLAEEEGVDPNEVPTEKPEKEDFDAEGRQLDVATRISRFAWDQSKKTVSVYVPFDGVGALEEAAVECIFRRRGVLVMITCRGKTYWYSAPNLCKEIDVDASRKTVKADQVVVKLRKAAEGLDWSDLTDEKDRYQERRKYRIEHGDLKGASTEQLLADMYQNATDEERAGLRDAMRINREKRAEEAAKQK